VLAERVARVLKTRAARVQDIVARPCFDTPHQWATIIFCHYLGRHICNTTTREKEKKEKKTIRKKH
jgi:hypothetical protein